MSDSLPRENEMHNLERRERAVAARKAAIAHSRAETESLMTDLPRVSVKPGDSDQGHQSKRVIYDTAGGPIWPLRGKHSDYMGTSIPAGDHVVLPAERWDEAPRVWWCAKYLRNLAVKSFCRAAVPQHDPEAFGCGWSKVVRLVETE
jgi:hypothetical protein